MSQQAGWPRHTSLHLTLTTQMMAGERNDSQIGHALAQGPLVMDIRASSSTTLWIGSKKSQDQESTNTLELTNLSWEAFQIMSGVTEHWGGHAERFASCGSELTCAAASSLWRCCCSGSSGTAGASCLRPGRSAQACFLPTPLAASFHCLAGREPPLTQRKMVMKLGGNNHTLASRCNKIVGKVWTKVVIIMLNISVLPCHKFIASRATCCVWHKSFCSKWTSITVTAQHRHTSMI